ncbi:MAG TPA: hypothetical protein V6C76_10675 [Drouetiella sp.]
MQDGDESKQQSPNEPGEVRDSEQASSEQDPGQPEKVYDFVHQHFGVALKSGGPESRAAEASGRNAVADKPQGVKSDSWHALKNLIRYQNSTTATSERNSYADEGSFGAQWNVSSSVLDDMDDLLEPHPDETSAGADQSVEAAASHATQMEAPSEDYAAEDGDVEFAGHVMSGSFEASHSEALHDVVDDSLDAVNLEIEAPILEAVHPDVEAPQLETIHADVEVPQLETIHADVEAPQLEAIHADVEPVKPVSKKIPGEDTLQLSPETMDVLKKKSANIGEETWRLTVEPTDEDTESASDAAEARSKFGTMNAFQKMKNRAQAQTDSRDKQATTGDMPQPVEEEHKEDEWQTLGPASTDGATIMNQWCSTSTGDSIPSLAELDSIPTPSVMQSKSSEKKSFSIKTPGVHVEQDVEPPPPDAVHSTARASWLQAASDYSASVIKAVTHQMKGLNAKPKKVTPESPEFHSSEPPEESDDISSM